MFPENCPFLRTEVLTRCRRYTINKISAKLIAIHNIPLPHTHIIIYCNKLNSDCCLSIDSVNVNKSRKVNILLLSRNHLHTFIINDIMSLDLLLTLFTHSTCCCLPTPMTLANGGSLMFPLVVHQPAFPCPSGQQ